MTDEELAALSAETGVDIETLRTFAHISDPVNAHLFTRESFLEAIKEVSARRLLQAFADAHQRGELLRVIGPVSVVVRYELTELNVVYVDDVAGTRYFIDADSHAPRPLRPGQALEVYATDDGHVLSAHEKAPREGR